MALHDPTKPKSFKRKMNEKIRAFRRMIFKIVYALPAGIVFLCQIKFINIGAPSRIGHLALELDWFLKKKQMGDFGQIYPILLLPPSRSANATLYDIWRPHFIYVANPIMRYLFRPFTYFDCLCIDTIKSVSGDGEAADYFSVVNRWADRGPIFKVPDDLINRGEQVLLDMGMPKGASIVCIHVRDGVYSPRDEFIHGFRNSDIGKCEMAIDAIIARGHWCVRMGEKGTPSLSPRHGLINYPDTDYKSEWMDIFLGVRTHFFIGNTSGLYAVSNIVDIPCVLLNMIPYGACYGLKHHDISIPKNLVSAGGQELSIADIFDSDISNYRYKSQFDSSGCTIIENTPEQIHDVVIEMLDVLQGKNIRNAGDEMIQTKFRQLLKEHHYCYGSHARIGRDFLRNSIWPNP